MLWIEQVIGVYKVVGKKAQDIYRCQQEQKDAGCIAFTFNCFWGQVLTLKIFQWSIYMSVGELQLAIAIYMLDQILL